MSPRFALAPRLAALLLAATTVLALAPFARKAFHVDDPLFLLAARRCLEAPFDPYGVAVNWYGTPQPLAEVLKNPPLGSYFLAVAGALGGWSEAPLHLAFLLPAVAVVTGTWALARRWSASPVTAALAALFSPVFLVSATSVMCDTPMLALWVWSLFFWASGIEHGDRRRLAAGAALAALAALTKYFAISLLPLLACHALLRRARPALWLPPLAIPAGALAAYQLWSRSQYGRGLLLDAAAYATATRGDIGHSAWFSLLTGIAFTGGAAPLALLVAPFAWSRRPLAVGAAATALAAGLVTGSWAVLHPQAAGAGSLAPLALHAAAFLGGGLAVLGLAAAELRRRSDPEAALLALWVLGTFAFAAVANWTVNARSLLPLVPAAAILVARRLGAATAAGAGSRLALTRGVPLALSAALALAAAWGDAALADAARRAARQIASDAPRPPAVTWFQGHWGFQHYMEAQGFRAMDVERPDLRPGDALAIPLANTNVPGLPPGTPATLILFEIQVPGPTALIHAALGAGFYSSVWGPLPFRLGRVPPDRYVLARIEPSAASAADRRSGPSRP